MFQTFLIIKTFRNHLLLLVVCVLFLMALWVSNSLETGINLPHYLQRMSSETMNIPQQVQKLSPRDKVETLPSPNKSTTPSPRRILPTIIPQQAWVRYPKDFWEGYQLPILTTIPQGRFGNVLMEYATLYALSRVYNVSAVVHPSMKRDMEYFSNISLKDMPGTYNSKEWTGIQSLEKNILNYAPLELAASGLLGPHMFVTHEWPHEIQLFDLVRTEIRQQFTWNKNITEKVFEDIEHIRVFLKKKGIQDPVFVGVHVRRTDYVSFITTWGGESMPTTLYFKRAFNYYKNKYKDAVFIISTDDLNYVKKEFKIFKDDIFLTPGESPQEDMALLNACNHSIITLGSFSFWTGYLTGGEVLYPDITFTNNKFYFARPYYEGVGLYFKPIPVK